MLLSTRSARLGGCYCEGSVRGGLDTTTTTTTPTAGPGESEFTVPLRVRQTLAQAGRMSAL